MDNSDLPVDSPNVEGRRTRLQQLPLRWVLIGFSIAGLVLGSVLVVVELPLITVETGSAFDTRMFIESDETELFDDSESVWFVSINQRQLTPATWLIAQFQPSTDIFHEDVLLRGGTFEELSETSALLMTQSQANAIAVATDRSGITNPADIRIITEGISGPSAGLSFTLTAIDVLTEGDLTGNVMVAATGAVNADGDVLPIGGARQKAFAVHESGFEVFLVPEANFDEASTAVPELNVIAVGTVDEAVDVLVDFGGDPPGRPAPD